MTTSDDFFDDINRSNSLMPLPLKYRWEFTRRHPVYLLCWKSARRFLKQEIPADCPEEAAAAYAAVMLLRLIGVTGEPIDPATSAEQLDQDDSVAPEFMAGPLQPMTLRQMLRIQILAMPHAELATVAALFNVASNRYREDGEVETEEEMRHRKYRAAAELNGLVSLTLDSFPVAPLYHIDPNASTRVVTAEVNRILRRWKQRSNIREQRLQLEALDNALAIWDRREGWTGEGYDLARCENLSKIAQALSLNRSTLVSRYASAFSWIIGNPYTVERWMRLFFAFHRHASDGQPSNSFTNRLCRMMSLFARGSRVHDEFSASRPQEDSIPSILDYPDAIYSETERTEFEIDLKDLLQKGKTDEQVAHILETSVELVAHVRSHLESSQS